MRKGGGQSVKDGALRGVLRSVGLLAESSSTARFLLIPCAVVMLSLALTSSPLHAAVIHVDTNSDTDDGGVSCSLPEAIANANSDSMTGDVCTAGSGADEIVFDTATIGSTSFTITLFSGPLPVVTSAITITGTGMADTVIEANTSENTATYRVFEVGATGDLTLNDLTVRHGVASLGGGIFNNGGSLTLNNVDVANNHASANGGGIFSTGITTLNGGLVNNNGADFDGGGLQCDVGSCTISQSTISDNNGRYGGGIKSFVTALISDSSITGNTASQDGGGLHNWGQLIVERSTISGNIAADDGGGIANLFGATLTNCTLSGNIAHGSVDGTGGGGIHQEQDQESGSPVPTMQLINTTVADNSHDTAGGDGIRSLGGSVTLTNSLVADNGTENCAGTFTSLGHNLDSDNTCSLAGTGDLPSTDPLLDVLADNGGPTQTMALLAASPALDAGDDATCASPEVGNIDQRGVTRPQDVHCDIGAYEAPLQLQTGPDFEVNTEADTDDGLCSAYDCSLREAINAANGHSGGPAAITFAGNYTITLAGTQLPGVAAETTITGNGAANTIIQASTCDPVNLPGGCTPATYRVLDVGSTGNLSLDGVTVRYGVGRGGGVYSAGTLTVQNSVIQNNLGTDFGSGIYSSGTVNVSATTLSGNSTGDGTLAVFDTATVDGCTFDHNTMTRGGGIYTSLNTTLNVINSTFAHNTASEGGGIHSRGITTIKSSTFAHNSAVVGKALHVWNGVSTNLYNNIMANNSGTAPHTCEAVVGANVNNLIDDGSCSAALTDDPLLDVLADNGGPTQTMALLAASPALEAGDDATCATVDQRGVSRPFGNHCDIGAYESEGVYDQTITFDPLADKAYGSGSVILTATASSGLPVSYASTTPGVCTVFGDNLVILGGVGSCSITASQAGDALYNPAPDVIQSFMVNMGNQTITFDPLADKVDTDPDFTISASASSGLLVMFSTVTTSVCSVSTNTVTILGPGTCTITASQPGNWNYNAAPDVDRSFTVYQHLGDSDSDGVDDAIDVDDDNDGLIEIGSLGGLDLVRNDLAGTSLNGTSTGCPLSGCNGYELVADLDFDTNSDQVIDAGDAYWNSGAGWNPIGDANFPGAPFTGIFNGNGHTIANLFIDRPDTDGVALFSYLSGATVINLTLAGDLTSVTGNVFTALLAGITDISTVDNCAVSGSVSSGFFGGGGLVGLVEGSSVSNCRIDATVTGGAVVGGVAGTANPGTTISTTFVTGSLTALPGGYSVGGLVGDGSDFQAFDSFSTASVTSDDDGGGLVGYGVDVTLTRCYGAGPVSASSTNGGLIGTVDPGGPVTVSYWDTEATGQATSADGQAVGLTTTEMQCPTGPDDNSCSTVTIYEGWSPAVWDFGTQSQYPVLKIGGLVYRDSDGDGYWDFEDAFPNDPTYWTVGSICGPDNGQSLPSTPTNLCDAGTPSAVNGTGPWTWTCSGVVGGPDASCSADIALPIVTTDAASAVGETTVTLNGTVDPNGSATTAWFEWGTSMSYGNRIPELVGDSYDVGTSGSTSIMGQLTGLAADTNYHYRAVAQSAVGTSYGGDQAFTTGTTGSSCASHWPLKIDGGLEYETFLAVLANVFDGDAILMNQNVVTEEVNIDLPGVSLLVEGGWSCDFTSRTGTMSTIRGSVTITDGTVEVDGVTID